MENITMTNATRIARVRVACPQAVGHLIAGIGAGAQGTTASALGFGFGGAFGTDRPTVAATRPEFYTPMHKLVAKDVAHLRSGRPPV
jgi:hypothetical protein